MRICFAEIWILCYVNSDTFLTRTVVKWSIGRIHCLHFPRSMAGGVLLCWGKECRRSGGRRGGEGRRAVSCRRDRRTPGSRRTDLLVTEATLRTSPSPPRSQFGLKLSTPARTDRRPHSDICCRLSISDDSLSPPAVLWSPGLCHPAALTAEPRAFSPFA